MELPDKKRVLPITSVITFLAFLDTTLLVPIMALYASSLGAGVGITGLIVGLYSITNTPANILFGKLIDRIGYKIPLVAGLFGDAISMFFYSLCRRPFHLALVRALHGMSGGLVGPATMSIFTSYSGTAKGRVMGLYGISLALANLVGFGASGFIASRLGYGTVFFLGAGLLTAGVVLGLLLPGSRVQNIPAAGVPFSHTLHQVKTLLFRKGLSVSYCSIFAQYFTFGGVVTLLPIHLDNLGMEAYHVGILLATFSVMFILTQFPGGFISDKAGRFIPVISGLILGMISLVALPLVEVQPLLIAAMALYGIAYGLLFPSISALIADNSSQEERGLATGIFHSLLTAGVAIGAPVIGWLGEWFGVQPGLIVIPSVMLLALVVTLFTVKRG